MKINLTFINILSLAVSGCGGNKPESAKTISDFDVLCDQFGLLVHSKNYASLKSEQRAATLTENLKTVLSEDSDAFMAWTAIQNEMPSQRSGLYKEAANSVGEANWSCEVIEKHGSEVGSSYK